MNSAHKSLLRMACAGIVALALWFAWDRLHDPFDNAQFDQVVWNKWRGSWDSDNPRGHMASALIDELKDRKLTRDEAIALLGSPEAKCGVLPNPVGPADSCISYSIGSWSGFRMDSDTLDVYFGNDGRVSDAITVQH
jgi:hypothetical protein